MQGILIQKNNFKSFVKFATTFITCAFTKWFLIVSVLNPQLLAGLDHELAK